MKKLSFVTLVFVFLFNFSYSQTYTISIDSVKGTPGDTVTVPIMVQGFKDIGAIGLVIPVDTNILTNAPGDSTGVDTNKAHIYKGIYNSYGSYFDKTNNRVSLYWQASGSTGLNIPNGTLIRLLFKFKPNIKGGTTLCFDTTLSSVAVSSTNSDVPVNFICGAVYEPTSISKVSTVDKSIEVFPNPSSDGKININFNGNYNVDEISVYNVDGAKVYDKVINSDNNIKNYQLSLPSQNKGVYILKIVTIDDIKYSKVVIQ